MCSRHLWQINPWGGGFNGINAEAEIFLTERVTMHNLNQGHLDMSSEVINADVNREKDAEAFRERHGGADLRGVSEAWEPAAAAGTGGGPSVEMPGRGSTTSRGSI